MKNKIIISGTGRSGTSFLVAILTELGLDTGFTPDNYMDSVFDNCNAGLEHHSIEDQPYILKSPYFSLLIPDIIKIVKVDMIYIPYRDIREVANSRINNGNKEGGMWLTENTDEQYDKLCYIFGKLISDAILYDVPFKIIDFRKMIDSPVYLFKKLSLVLEGKKFHDFLRVYKKVMPLFKRKI